MIDAVFLSHGDIDNTSDASRHEMGKPTFLPNVEFYLKKLSKVKTPATMKAETPMSLVAVILIVASIVVVFALFIWVIVASNRKHGKKCWEEVASESHVGREMVPRRAGQYPMNVQTFYSVQPLLYNPASIVRPPPINTMAEIYGLPIIRAPTAYFPSAHNRTIFHYLFAGGGGSSRVYVHDGDGYNILLFTLQEQRRYRIFIGLTGQIFALDLGRQGSQHKTWIEFENPHRHKFSFYKTMPDNTKFEIHSPRGYHSLHQSGQILIEWEGYAYLDVYPDLNTNNANIWADEEHKNLSVKNVKNVLGLQVYYTIDADGYARIFNTADVEEATPAKSYLTKYNYTGVGLSFISTSLFPAANLKAYITITTPKYIEYEMDPILPDLPNIPPREEEPPEEDTAAMSNPGVTGVVKRSITWQSVYDDGFPQAEVLPGIDTWNYTEDIFIDKLIPWTEFNTQRYNHIYILSS